VRLVPTSAFRRRAKKLSLAQRAALERAVRRFQSNPFDPVQRTHKPAGELEGKWAFSVTYDLRVVCSMEGDLAYLLAMGGHDEGY
jgi:mRNA-degrading endonuclease YafQ of YafQ-DinJ toxin-antitoxin module